MRSFPLLVGLVLTVVVVCHGLKSSSSKRAPLGGMDPVPAGSPGTIDLWVYVEPEPGRGYCEKQSTTPFVAGECFKIPQGALFFDNQQFAPKISPKYMMLYFYPDSYYYQVLGYADEHCEQFATGSMIVWNNYDCAWPVVNPPKDLGSAPPVYPPAGWSALEHGPNGANESATCDVPWRSDLQPLHVCYTQDWLGNYQLFCMPDPEQPSRDIITTVFYDDSALNCRGRVVETVSTFSDQCLLGTRQRCPMTYEPIAPPKINGSTISSHWYDEYAEPGAECQSEKQIMTYPANECLPDRTTWGYFFYTFNATTLMRFTYSDADCSQIFRADNMTLNQCIDKWTSWSAHSGSLAGGSESEAIYESPIRQE